MNSLKAKVKKLPNGPGVYIFCDPNKNMLYIGKAISLKKRVASYFQNKHLGPKTTLLVKKIADIKCIKVFSEFEALLLEAQLIKENQPFFNAQSKDDKSPLYIKMTNDQIPLVTVTRREKPKRGIYLKGPFPSAKTTKEVLRIIRKIFPYCHHKNPKKPCLFVHLGLCPYPYASEEAKNQYLNTITKIKKLLSGQTRTLLNQLKNDMMNLSKQQRFEEANQIKKQILNLEYVITSYHQPKDFLERPTLVDDFVTNRLRELKTVLNLPKIPKRIECFDISNISGKNATGSMVVFENGRAAKHQYRRFRIKFSNTPNDYQMLKEVLSRRFKNNWPNPDLVIIDGGKGQLNSALVQASKLHIPIKIISIAKRLEEIYTHGQNEPIRLEKQNAARQLVQEMRDEAHRFAINYHRLLRSKQLVS